MIIKNTTYTGEYSLLVSNYPPCSSAIDPNKPLHEAAILPGKQEGAYFVGEYEKCVEALNVFIEDYNRYYNEFKNEHN